MASSTSNQPVVQVIFDSLTRCFNPIDGESPFPNRCSWQSPHDAGETSTPSAMNNAARNATTATATTREKSSRSSSGGNESSSNNASSNNNVKYNADRYMHRKLEIFRTTEEEKLTALAQSSHGPNSNKQQQQQGGANNGNTGGRGSGTSSQQAKGRHQHQRNRSAGGNTLVYSSSDEIANLTAAHNKRAADNARFGQCGAGIDNDVHPIEALVRLLRDPFSCIKETQKVVSPFGLCFANPIRSADSAEENAFANNMADWKLTAEEFAARQARLEVGGGCGTTTNGRNTKNGKKNNNFKFVDAVPDTDESSASQSCENEGQEDEETITSASYFDQKYSHLVEKNPPQPLFRENRIAVSEFETDELFNLVKRRGGVMVGVGGSSSPSKSNGMVRNSPSRGRNNKPSDRDRSPHPNSKHRSSSSRPKGPPGGIIVKNKSSRSGKGRSTSTKRRPFGIGQSKRDRQQQQDMVPVGKSSSVSDTPSADAAEELAAAAARNGSSYRRSPRQMRLREPDIVYSTAAGI